MLAIQSLQFRRGDAFRLAVPQWEAPTGEVRAVLGTNGAGKSTFLRLLSGEEKGRGEITLHGRALDNWPALERARHLGVLPQSSSLNFSFTAEEVVSLGLTPLQLGWREARRTVQSVMRATDCTQLAHKNYPVLSGGERQRIHLARVLVQLSQAEKPPVLLLDEPTSAQDLGQQHRMLELARNLAREHDYCVVAILHDLNLALRYTDQCLLLNDGEAVASGAPEAVIQASTIQRYWGYEAAILSTAEGIPVIA